MDLLTGILVVLQKIPPGRATRTALQKLAYFATRRGLLRASFEAHYYGPYSSDVASTLEDLASAGLVLESVKSWVPAESPWEGKKYEYTILPGLERLEDVVSSRELRGAKNLQELVGLCAQITELDPKSLSAAAKVHFILEMEKRSLFDAEIREEAGKLGWKLSDQEIEGSVVGLLSALGLANRG